MAAASSSLSSGCGACLGRCLETCDQSWAKLPSLPVLQPLSREPIPLHQGLPQALCWLCVSDGQGLGESWGPRTWGQWYFPLHPTCSEGLDCMALSLPAGVPLTCTPWHMNAYLSRAEHGSLGTVTLPCALSSPRAAEQFGLAVSTLHCEPDSGTFGYLFKPAPHMTQGHRHPEMSPQQCLTAGISSRSTSFFSPLPRLTVLESV